MADQKYATVRVQVSNNKTMTNTQSKPFIPITGERGRLPIRKKDMVYWRRLQHIIANWQLYEDEILRASTRYSNINKMEIKRRCEDYLKAATRKGDIGYINVTYTAPESNIGRVYTKTPSLQNLVRIIRHTITRGLYLDIDMKNAMPTLLAQYALKHGLDLPTIQRYVTQRIKMLEELTKGSGLDYEEGKATVHTILNNGLGALKGRDSPPWITQLIGEVQTLAEHIQKKEIEIWRLAEEKAKKKQALGEFANAIGSAMAMLYGQLEHECLMCMHDKLKELKLIGRAGVLISLIFDGTMIPDDKKLLPDEAAREKLLRQLEKAINEGTGYKVELAYKGLDEGLTIPDDEDLQDAMEEEAEEEVDIMAEMGWKDNALGDMLLHFTHDTVARYFVEQKKGGMKYCSVAKKWYVIDDPAKSCIWVENDTALGLENSVKELVKETLCAEARKIIAWCGDNPPDGYLMKVGNDIDSKYLNFIGNQNFIESVVKAMRTLLGVRHDRFADDLDANPNVLPFSDKLVYLDHMGVRAIRPDDYISKTTGYPYPSQRITRVREVIKGIIRGMQIDDANYHYLMSVLAACLPGKNLMQEMYIFWGPGGNGKSLIQHIFFGALGGYSGGLVAKVRSQTMVRPPRAANDHDDWAKTKGCRAYWCPEVRKGDVMQEDVIRQQTGGEDIVARDCGGKSTTFRATATPLCGFNDMPKMPTDQSILRRVRVLSFPYLFVPQEKLDEEPKNETLKLRVNEYEEMFKSKEYQVEFMGMLLDHWEMHVLGRSTLPQTRESKEATHNAIFGTDRFREFLVNNTVLDEDAFIPVKTLKDMYNAHLEKAGLNTTSAKMLAKFMKDKGYESIHKRNGWVYPGIRGLTPAEIREREQEERMATEEYQNMLQAIDSRATKRTRLF